MIIDLSLWNEYIADDVPPGKVPEGVRIEAMQIVTNSGVKLKNGGPTPIGIIPERGTFKCRLFWRLLE